MSFSAQVTSTINAEIVDPGNEAGHQGDVQLILDPNESTWLTGSLPIWKALREMLDQFSELL